MVYFFMEHLSLQFLSTFLPRIQVLFLMYKAELGMKTKKVDAHVSL